MKKVSIIVPVYNCEEYLEKTLESLLVQTYENTEIILVNDSSPDNSEAICQTYAQKYPQKIKSFTIDNRGPSGARNFGISKASGEYIGFCDSDDTIASEMYESLISYLEKSGADIALCDIFSERDGRAFGFPWEDGTCFEGDAVASELMAAMIGNQSDNDSAVPLWGSAVRCLYKKALIESAAVRFPEDIHFAEDLVFTLRYLAAVKRAVICTEPFYFYRVNENSIMHSFYAYKKEMFWARKQLVQYLKSIISALPNAATLLERLAVTERCYFAECVGNACRSAPGRSEEDKKAELSEILNDAEVRAVFESFDARDKRKRLIYTAIQKRMKQMIYAYYRLRFRGQ